MTFRTRLRNVGILAHVDAGKTTVTEQMLYLGGAVQTPGRVDNGTAFTDFLEVEKERGISVRAATTELHWKDCRINLIDTPGHVDFSSEVERSLRVLDGAILVVSAAEGVQPHTETLWQALRAMRVPTLIFVNKMDRIGASQDKAVADIQKQLSPFAAAIQQVAGAEGAFTGVRHFLESDELLEKLADADERLLEKFVAGASFSVQELEHEVARLTRSSKLFPVCFGSALKGIGVAELLDAVMHYLPAPDGDEEKPVSGLVFKIERDKAMGKMAYVRLFNGKIENRDTLFNAMRNVEEKVTQIRKAHALHYEDTGMLRAGDIGVVYGLQAACIGDVIGDGRDIPAAHHMAVPLLTVQVTAKEESDYPALAAALHELSEEDPLLDLQWLQNEREMHVKIMGAIQIEVLTSMLRSRYQIEAEFGRPSVIYKETPAAAAEGYVSYTMPKPCWAILRFWIEPAERGSGISYRSLVRTEHLLERYQNEVERRLPEALSQGLYGWEVTDANITLVEGEHHVWHTHPLDFAVATPMGIMDGLARAGTTLLEPIAAFRLTAPEHTGGRLLSELSQMRAELDNPFVSAERIVIEGRVPVASSLDFPVRLSALTAGYGTWAARFDGYKPCPLELGAARKRRGVNPLDRAKYILGVRSAL